MARLITCSSFNLVAMAEQPKKYPSSYFLFLDAKKDEFVKEAGTYKEGISLAAKAWRALSATDKKPYAEEAAKRKLQYEKELKAFLEAGGEKKKTKQILDVTPTKRRKKETTAAKGDDTTPSRKRKYHVNARKDDEPTPSKERKKDANAPKRPAGGAYGCYLEENRQRFMQQCKGQSATAVSKMAGEAWKALTAEDRKPFQDMYASKKKAYDKAKEAYKKSGGGSPAGDHAEGDGVSCIAGVP